MIKESLSELRDIFFYDFFFLFVDEIFQIDDDFVKGKYRYWEDEYFY